MSNYEIYKSNKFHTIPYSKYIMRYYSHQIILQESNLNLYQNNSNTGLMAI